jgi:hypothetical protein
MPNAHQFQPIDSYDLTGAIPSGQTTTPEIDLAGNALVGFFFPAAFTGATLTITAASASGGTFLLVQKDEAGGGAYTVTVTAGKYVPVTNLAIVAGLRFIKLVSASSEGADRIITLAVRPV